MNHPRTIDVCTHSKSLLECSISLLNSFAAIEAWSFANLFIFSSISSSSIGEFGELADNDEELKSL